MIFLYSVIGSLYLESFYVANDIWDHVAQITAFKDNPFTPVDPHLRGGTTSHLLTPYHFILGVLAKITGFTPLIIFTIAGLLNLLFFLYSVRVVAQSMYEDKKYSLIVLIVLLAFWIFPPGSSGIFNFSLIPLTLGYPYRAVFPILLITIAKFNNELDLKTYILYTLTTAFVFTTHPLSGIYLMLLMSTKSLLSDGWSTKKLVVLCLPVLSLFITFFWPYYPILKFIGLTQGLSVFNLPEAYKFHYKTIYTVTLLIIPSILIVIDKIRARERDFRSSLLIFLTPIVILNFLYIHNETIARLMVLVTFILHLLTIEWLITKWLQRGKSRQLAFIFISMVLLVMQMEFSFRTISIFPDILRKKPIGYHSNFRYYNQFLQLDEWIKDGGVILAPIDVSVMIGRITHQNIVAYYHANPAVAGSTEKNNDVNRFFHTSQKNEKLLILQKYRVSYLVTKEPISSILNTGINVHKIGEIDYYPVYRIDSITSQ